MGATETGQLISSAAEIYDEFFVPALFQEWPVCVIASAGVKAGDRVLDVACGTGVLARAAQTIVGPAGSVTGLDINQGMLEVARRKGPSIDWKEGRAEALPFEDNRFDAVLSTFGLMFFEDQPAAIREMMRVLRPGGRLALAVWGPLRRTPGYAAQVDLLGRLFGNGAAEALKAPYSLGDGDRLRAVFSKAGYPQVQVETKIGSARFPSIREWMFIDIKGWTLADQLTAQQFERLLAEAESVMQVFVRPDGSVTFDAPALIATLDKG